MDASAKVPDYRKLSAAQQQRVQALVEMTRKQDPGRHRRFAVFPAAQMYRNSPNDLGM